MVEIEYVKTDLNPVREIHQVIGCLLQNPSLLMNKKYKLLRNDFPEMFHKSIFAAIHNLAMQDVKEIDEIAIDNYLSNYESFYDIFLDNNGIEWLHKAREFSNLSNFDYNYQQIKKFTLLRAYTERGIDVTDLYDSTVVDINQQGRMQAIFDDMSVEDIIRHYKEKLLGIEDEFTVGDSTSAKKAGEGSMSIKERFKEEPLMGLGLESEMLTTIARGALKKRFMISSSDTGNGILFWKDFLLGITGGRKYQKVTQ